MMALYDDIHIFDKPINLQEAIVVKPESGCSDSVERRITWRDMIIPVVGGIIFIIIAWTTK